MAIKLISQDPYFVPSDEAIETVKLLMEGLAEGFQCAPWKSEKQDEPVKEITAQHCVWEKPRFVSFDESLQEVTCPACGKIFGWSDEEEEMAAWKLKQQIQDSEDAMQLKIKMPCCDTEIAVTSIDFASEYGGFSRFTLSVDDHDGFNETDILLFEKIMGCKLTQIEC